MKAVELAVAQKDCWRNIASLTMSAVSSTFGAHCPVHSEECAISLSRKLLLLLYQPRLARNRFSGQKSQSDPCISSVIPSIMITSSDSPVKGSGTPNQLLGVRLHTTAISRLSRVRTELFHLFVIPFLA